MARTAILGNGSLTVGLDEHGLVHDFYYPYVGLDNLTTARSVQHKIGVWVNGTYAWVDDSWDISVELEDDALVSNVRLTNDTLKLELRLNDFVDPEFDAFCRQITVTNNADENREIRVFLHQVFQISRSGRADTALYVPDDNYILDYKGRCSLLIYARDPDTYASFDNFAIGNYGIEGKEGTFKDAEDGELSGSAVEHGGVDSVIQFNHTIASHSSANIDYWIIAAESQYTAEKIHNRMKDTILSHRLYLARQHWDKWLSIGSNKLHVIDTKYLSTVKKSMMVIKAHIDKRGGIIASCDSSIYNYGRDYYSYVWPRDGAYAVWPLIKMGYKTEAKQFFNFCSDIITEDGYLMHKYQPDKAVGSTWHPLLHRNSKELAIQQDETAIIIFMLNEYLQHSKDSEYVHTMYDSLVKPAANFLVSFIDEATGLPHASYDLWEEKFLTSTYTTILVYRALMSAANIAEHCDNLYDASEWRSTAQRIMNSFNKLYESNDGVYSKGLLLAADGTVQYDNTLDVSSAYGVMMFGTEKNSHQLHKTIHAIEETLLDKSPSQGLPRYEHDDYFASKPAYKGNPWLVTTLWLAQYYILNNKLSEASKYLQWAMDKTTNSGMMPEQVDPTSGAPVSVTPLIWSHAEFINTALDLSEHERNKPA